MGLKDLKLFPMEQISVTKIQGRTNTRQKERRGSGRQSSPSFLRHFFLDGKCRECAYTLQKNCFYINF